MSIPAYHLFLRVFPIYKGSWWDCTTFMFFKSLKNCLQKKTRIPLKCFQDSASILLEFYLIYLSIFYFKTSIKTSCNQMDYVCVGSVISNYCNSLGYSPPGSSIHGFFWSGLPFPTLWDLPDPGLELTSLASSAPAGGFFTTEPPESEVKVKSLSHVWLFVTLWTVAHQAPPSMGFSRQECWSGLPFPSPGDLPKPGIEPRSSAL